jgi:LuxR family transcriptional regulator, maltose regulon positive regulatory protein
VVDHVDRHTDPAAAAALRRLIASAEGRYCVVIAGRGDPAGMLRVPGAEAADEIAVADLALTLDETGDLVTAHDVVEPATARAAVFRLTGGWAAGVRLAALALRGQRDAEAVLADGGPVDEAMSGYLVAEVLRPLPAPAREALLATIVVPALDAALAAALTGRADGARVLRELQDAGVFLDRRSGPGGWYRFHSAFARMAYRALCADDPVRTARQHRRAGWWHDAYGLPAEAVRHHLLGDEWRAAAKTLRRHWADIAAGLGRHRGRCAFRGVLCAQTPATGAAVRTGAVVDPRRRAALRR